MPTSESVSAEPIEIVEPMYEPALTAAVVASVSVFIYSASLMAILAIWFVVMCPAKAVHHFIS